MTDNSNDAGGEEQEQEIKKVQTAKIRTKGGREESWRPTVTVTEAIEKATGNASREVIAETSIRFFPGEYGNLGLLPGQLVEKRGRSELERSITPVGAKDNPSYRVTIPTDVLLETLGVDEDEIFSDDPPEVEVFAGAGILAFDTPDRQVVRVPQSDAPNGVDPDKWMRLSDVVQSDYRAVEIEGSDPEEVAEDRGVKAKSVQQNIRRAKHRLSNNEH